MCSCFLLGSLPIPVAGFTRISAGRRLFCLSAPRLSRMTAAVLLILYLYQIVPKEKRDLVHQRNRTGKISEESPISRPPLFPLMWFHPASHYSAILQKALPIVIMFIILALILFHQKRLTTGNEKMTFERYVMLKYDPLAVFRASRTPAGIYASSRWLGQGHDRSGRLISIEGLRRSTRDSSGTAAGQNPPYRQPAGILSFT